jgi:hypothetical protein
MQPAMPSPPSPAQPSLVGPPTSAGTGLGAMLPAALAQPPRNPSSPPPPLKPPPDPTSPNTDPEHIPSPSAPQDIQNIFERRGALLALGVQEQGQRLAEAMAQPPTNAVKLDQGQLADFWRYSPVARDEASANAAFWIVHDRVLQETGDPAKAEQTAMEQVFPWRAALVGRGVASIDKQVEQAQSIRKLVDGSLAPPDGPIARVHHMLNQGMTG